MTSTTGRLAEKHVLVTGGATGIGDAIVQLFHREGARLLVGARDDDRGARMVAASGGSIAWTHLDITDPRAWQQLVSSHADDPFDVLVNNAGGLRFPKPLHLLEPDEWRVEIDTNLSGAFYGMRYVIPQMLARGGGTIVNIGSISGVRAQADAAGYQAAKAGLSILGRHAAFTYARSGIRINTIVPGSIATASVLAEPAERTRPFAEHTPMGRMGTPAEVAAVALFLASDELSFVTGADYVVDGGYLL